MLWCSWLGYHRSCLPPILECHFEFRFTPLPFQFPINMPGEAADVPISHEEDQMEFLASGFGLAKPWLLQPYLRIEPMNETFLYFFSSFSLSFSLALFLFLSQFSSLCLFFK